MNLNKIELIGRACADPQVKTFDNGGKVCNLSIATNERAYKTSNGIEVPEKTDFHNVTFKGKLAEICGQYVTKGMELYVEGSLHYRKYTDSNNVERTISEIVVRSMQMGRKAGEGNHPTTGGNGNQQPTTGGYSGQQQPPQQMFTQNDDLPF
jgi:single-strand DNA-binding protein